MQTATAIVEHLRSELSGFEIKKPVPGIHRELGRGWLLPALLAFDDMTYGRWDYWGECMYLGRCPDRPIPPLDFLASANKQTWKMLEKSLDAIPNHGSWQTWGGFEYFRYFLEWLLYGFGCTWQKEMPQEPAGCEGASDRLYQIFNVGAMLVYPYDYFGDMLAENKYGKGAGFFPTPLELVKMICAMTMRNYEGDLRTASVLDPCTGTGRFLLVASNYSLNLAGIDIDRTMCLATLVNGYLYAPWLVRRPPFLDAQKDAQKTAQEGEAAPQAAPVIEINPALFDVPTERVLTPERRERRTRIASVPDTQEVLF